jgi:hypothetical protein
VKRKTKSPERAGEFYYATHYHLIPLYVISGVLIVAMLLMGCYLRFLWTTEQANAFARTGPLMAQGAEDSLLQMTMNPADKKQYVAAANIRFTSTDPYQIMRYSYDPGDALVKNGAAIGVTTSSVIRRFEEPLMHNLTPQNFDYVNRFQQCTKLYVIRFQAGATQYGGYSPFKDVKLKDGRTAYIHKNTNCLNDTIGDSAEIKQLEATLLTIESY